MSDLLERFRRAVAEFDARVQQISDDQWGNPTPCDEWDVRALVNHLVYEDLWARPLFEGKTIEEVGDRFDGDLLGDDPKAAWSEASRDAIAAAEADGALERTVHLSYGDVTGGNYLGQLLNDHVIHAWDLARGIGSNDTLDADLVETLYANAKPMEDTLKGSGLFGDKIEPPPDADTQTKLLAVMGRRV